MSEATDDGILIISGRDVDQLIAQHIPLSAILQSQHDVFVAVEGENAQKRAEMYSSGAGDIAAPLRTPMPMPSHTGLFMPARFFDDTTCKIVSVPRPDASRDVLKAGLPAATLVLNSTTGKTRALVEASKLTALRTAAGSTLSCILAHRQSCFAKRSPRAMTIFGGGPQGIFHAAQLCGLFRPASQGEAVENMTVTFVTRSEIDRDKSAEAKKLVQASAGGRIIDFSFLLSSDEGAVEASVRRAEVIVTATPSSEPLFQDAWVQRGAHLMLVGSYKPHMQEIEEATVRRAKGRLFVDSVEACASEAGDLIKAGIKADDCIPLGEALAAASRGGLRYGSVDAEGMSGIQYKQAQHAREHTGDLSLFKSVGIGLQDVAIASLIVKKAREYGIGTRVDF